MKKIVLYAIINVLFIININSQINNNHYFGDYYKEISNTDSLLRTQNSDLEDSYFVMTYPIENSVSSFGMQLYKAYHSIKDKGKPIILLVSNEIGVRTNDLGALIKRVLRISDEELNNISIVNNPNTYSYIVKGRQLVRLLYI